MSCSVTQLRVLGQAATKECIYNKAVVLYITSTGSHAVHIAVVVRLPSANAISTENAHNSVKLEQRICEWDCGCTGIVHYTWSVP